MANIDKIVIITKKTWLEELIERFNTKEQAKFYIEHMGGSFEEYEGAHLQYYQSLEQLKRLIPPHFKYQVVERSFLPNFLFGSTDLVVVIGPDGLVINTAKYLENQYILAINPDPSRIDGILIPFLVEEFPKQLKELLNEDMSIAKITLAKAELNNNQYLFGVNDLFIGHRSHVSARYTISYQGMTERQSSSGIIVSTGAGSSGWFKSIVYGAIGTTNRFRFLELEMPSEEEYRFPWDSNYLYFSVREPFESRISKTNIVFGRIYAGEYLEVESNMPENGVIFSDGIEKDYLNFNSGAVAKIGVAEKKANLIV